MSDEEQIVASAKFEFEIPSEVLERLANLETHGVEKEVRDLKGGRSRIVVGTPDHYSLQGWLKGQAAKIPFEIKQQLDDYDFCRVEFPVAFLPDQNCRFSEITFTVELFYPDAPQDAEQPSVYDLLPKDTRYERKISSKSSPVPGVTLEFDKLKLNVSPSKSEKSEEYITYNFSIEQFNARTEKAGWIFKHTDQAEISKSCLLFMTVRKRKNRPIRVKYQFDVQLQVIGRFLTKPFTAVLVDAYLSDKEGIDLCK